MLGLEPPVRSGVDWRRQNLIELKRTQCRNRERKRIEEHSQTKKGPLKAHHPMPVSPRLLEEIDIPDLNSDTTNIFNDVSLLARRQRVEEILDDIWSTQPLSDQGTYYSSRKGKTSRSRSKCSNSRISINNHPFSKQTNLGENSKGAYSRLSNSTPDLSKLVKGPKKIIGTNYVKANASNVASHRKRHPSEAESPSSRKPEVIPAKPGTIPKYLKQRKDQWKKDAELKERSKPDPNCPPGHVLVSESNRIGRLESLESKMKALVEEFSHLPMGKNTLRVQTRKKEIEDELRQTEESLRIYAKPKVYVPETQY